ncbi:MAG: restriction endonuclease [Betaproteobacteria bacterium]|nr:restriction endonuclease [Betaproteobacteria bacterium]
MAKQTLFSILTRQPWWMSVIIAAALFAAVRLFLPDFAAFFAALPFLAVAGYAGWTQLRAPSVTNVTEALGKLRALPWENFSAVISEAFRRDGYSVAEIANGAVDLELRRNNRVSIVSCRRWKVAQTGVGPLRELYEAKRARDAQECIYVAAGDFSANARAFAAEKTIKLLSDTELARLVARVERGKRRWLPW